MRKPSSQKHRSLLNESGIGLLTLSENYEEIKADVLTTKARVISFD